MNDLRMSHHEQQAEAHRRLRESPAWEQAARLCNGVHNSFLLGLRSVRQMSWRHPSYEESLVMRFTDDLVESAVATQSLIHDGAHNPARRELRYVLEATVNHLHVDQLMPSASLKTKLAFLNARAMIETLTVGKSLALFIETTARDQFKSTLVELYALTSQYVHPRPLQLEERLARHDRGIFIGFETPAELREVVVLAARVYDLALCCVFHALGQGMTGDLFVHVFDEMIWWPYHYLPLTHAVSSTFNYKHERQQERGGPVRDRVEEWLELLALRADSLGAR